MRTELRELLGLDHAIPYDPINKTHLYHRRHKYDPQPQFVPFFMYFSDNKDQEPFVYPAPAHQQEDPKPRVELTAELLKKPIPETRDKNQFNRHIYNSVGQSKSRFAIRRFRNTVFWD